jgi:hypothetical protein
LKLYHPKLKVSFSAAKKRKFPSENGMRTPTLTCEKKKLKPKPHFFLLLFRLFLTEILSRRYRLSQTTSDPAQKSGKQSGQNCVHFPAFFRQQFWLDFVTPFSTFANIKGSLPTKSTTPD